METTQPESSFSTILINVFSAPSEAAMSLKDGKPSTSTWLVPFLLTCAIVVLFSYLFATNATFHQQMVDIQNEQLQKQVESGALTQERADQAREGFENLSPAVFVAIGSVAGSFFVGLFFFGAALVLWLVAKYALHATQGYGKYLELYGASALIGFVGAIVTLALMMGLNTMYASPSAALAVLNDFNPMNKTHKLLAALNVFSIWQAVFIGGGLSKFSGKSSAVGIGTALGLFAAWTVVSVMLNIGR